MKRKIINIVIYIFAGFGFVSLMLILANLEEKNYDYNDYNQINELNNRQNNLPKKELTESEKMITKISALTNEKLAFDASDYIKGDIPKGEYAFVRVGESRQYYSEEDIAGNIIDNNSFSSFGYVYVHGVGEITTGSILVNTTAFQSLEVSGAKELYEIINNHTDYNQSGIYKIGVDIPPGKYLIESIGNGYFATLSGPVGNSDIIENDGFNGKKEITVMDGQYLEISKAQITHQ